MEDLDHYIEAYRPKHGQYVEERAGRAVGIGIMVGLFRLAEAIETASTTLGNSIEFAAHTIADD